MCGYSFCAFEFRKHVGFAGEGVELWYQDVMLLGRKVDVFEIARKVEAWILAGSS